MRAAIIGGGAAGMYAAVMLAQAGHSVTIYEKNEINELQNECSLVIKGYKLDDISYLESIEDSSLRVTLIDLEGNVIFHFDCFETNPENGYKYCVNNTGWTVNYKGNK